MTFTGQGLTAARDGNEEGTAAMMTAVARASAA
jgi:hypothetical protein